MLTSRNGASMSSEKKKEPESFFSYSNLKSLSIMIIAILAIRWSVASPYHVPTPSMEPTIKVGDRLLAFKLSYSLKMPFTDWVLFDFAPVKRGDIIVFKYPKDPDIDFVKRVVAIAGDQIKLVDDIVYLNGQAQEKRATPELRAILEDITDHKERKDVFREVLDGKDHWVIQDQIGHRTFSNGNWPRGDISYTVPENSVFCMGDNRDNSADSRVWGEVPLSYVRGKALFVLWSAFQPDNGLIEVRWDRFGHWLDDFDPEDSRYQSSPPTNNG